jgi:hypothetical protein
VSRSIATRRGMTISRIFTRILMFSTVIDRVYDIYYTIITNSVLFQERAL